MIRELLCVVMGLLCGPVTLSAQEQVKGEVRADVVSHYMWRGLDKGGFSVQPQATVRWQGLSLQMYGSAGLNKEDNDELDLSLRYERAGFSIGVTDYWQTGIDPKDRYLYYSQRHGAHRFEGTVGYTCPYGSLHAYTMFGGNDFKRSGKRAYSTYVELSVPFELGGIKWTARAGMSPFESAGYDEIFNDVGFFGDETHVEPHYTYADGAACVLASLRATREITLHDLRIPVFAELHGNPYLQKATLVFGLSIVFF